MTVKDLTEDERDVILEIFNMGIGAAAGTLSEMVGAEVVLTLPSLSVVSCEALSAQDWSPVAAVFQGFVAPVGEGRATLSFPEQRSLALVARLANTDATVELTAFQEEALTEVGNILLNSVLARLSDMIRKEIVVSVPRLRRAESLMSLIEEDETEGGVLVLSVKLDLKDERIDGRLLFFTEVGRLKPLIHLVRANSMGG